MNFRIRSYLSVMHMCRAFKHRGIKPPHRNEFDYHLHKQRTIARKEYKNEKLEKYLNTVKQAKGQQCVSLYVVSTGCHGIGRSVLLQIYEKRYLFNCVEGSQKYIYDIVDEVENMNNVFITHNSWNNVGGLIGLLLTDYTKLFEGNMKNLHGPYNLTKFLSKASMFVNTYRRLEDHINWFDVGFKTYEDSHLDVDYVELKNAKSCDTKHTHSDYYCSNNYSNNEDKKQNEPSTSVNEGPVMAYIIKIKSQELNDKRMTVDTHDIYYKKETVKDNAKIQPAGSLNSEDEFKPIIVLDCPTVDYMDSLLTSKHFIDFDKKYGHQPEMIVHMAPREIIEDHRYKEFMSRFGDNTVHLMLNENCYGPVVHGSQEVSLIYHQLLPNIFPQLSGLQDLYKSHNSQIGNIVQGVYSLQYIFNAGIKSGFQWDELPHMDKESVLEKAKSEAQRDAWSVVEDSEEHSFINEKWTHYDKSMIDDEVAKLHAAVVTEDTNQDLLEEYPEITFLGTGSAIPSGNRNTSCILVQLKKDSYIMLDCGEGTLIQMYQMYGKEKTDHILLNLKAVFVSHHHFDHHGGLCGITNARDKLMEKVEEVNPLILVVPNSIMQWYDFYSSCFPGQTAFVRPISNRELFNSVRLPQGHHKNLDEVKKALNLDEFICVPVTHSISSYGLVIKHEDGWKLTYSGDCIPSPELICYGQDSDILIHEGTFDDSITEYASKSKHSTTSQAIEVAEEMCAKFTILTHFSQKTKIPHFTERFTDSIGFAFDFMQVRPSQFKLIPLLKPVLETLFGASTVFALMKIQRYSEKFRDKYTDVVEEKAANALLSKTKYDKQVERINRQLWLDHSQQLKRNLMINDQSETMKRLKSTEDIGDNVEDINDNKYTNCDMENPSEDFEIRYSKNKIFIEDSLLETLCKSRSTNKGDNS